MLIFTMLLIFVILVLILLLKLYYLITHTNYCKSKVCLVGKTALVTGGNTGIGYQIVLALAQRGCKVIVAHKKRDPDLLQNIFEETQSRNVTFKHVDLSSFNSVRKLAKYMIENEEKLDILVNNAGIGSNVSTLTEDGFETVMQVNYFSAFLLTRLLEDLLKKASGRIIFTSSLTCLFHDFSMEKLKSQGNESVNYMFHYPNSKICLIMAADKFAEKLKEFGVTSNTYHPGLVKTNIFSKSIAVKDNFNITWFIIKILEVMALLIGKSAEEGAQTAIYLACANEVKDVTGSFFSETKPANKPKLVYNKEICNAVWETTEALVNSKLN